MNWGQFPDFDILLQQDERSQLGKLEKGGTLNVIIFQLFVGLHLFQNTKF